VDANGKGEEERVTSYLGIAKREEEESPSCEEEAQQEERVECWKCGQGG